MTITIDLAPEVQAALQRGESGSMSMRPALLRKPLGFNRCPRTINPSHEGHPVKWSRRSRRSGGLEKPIICRSAAGRSVNCVTSAS